MNAIGIMAGPRKGHATDAVVDAVLKGIREKGGAAEKLYLCDHVIAPCKGCMSCEKTSRCVIEDDAPKIFDKMDRADIVVFGSPTYWSNVTSAAKAFFDRGVPFFTMTAMGPRRLADKPAKIVLVTTCGAPWPFSVVLGVSTGCMRAMKVFFGRMKASIRTLTVAGMLTPQAMPSEKTLQKAYRLGKSL